MGVENGVGVLLGVLVGVLLGVAVGVLVDVDVADAVCVMLGVASGGRDPIITTLSLTRPFSSIASNVRLFPSMVMRE